MSAEWTWTFHGSDGETLSSPTPPTSGFPSQGEAESWLGESWRDLLESGVQAVTLHHHEDLVYGPMSLRSDQ